MLYIKSGGIDRHEGTKKDEGCVPVVLRSPKANGLQSPLEVFSVPVELFQNVEFRFVGQKS